MTISIVSRWIQAVETIQKNTHSVILRMWQQKSYWIPEFDSGFAFYRKMVVYMLNWKDVWKKENIHLCLVSQQIQYAALHRQCREVIWTQVKWISLCWNQCKNMNWALAAEPQTSSRITWIKSSFPYNPSGLNWNEKENIWTSGATTILGMKSSCYPFIFVPHCRTEITTLDSSEPWSKNATSSKFRLQTETKSL